jgi:ketol-acid reductoisomerase
MAQAGIPDALIREECLTELELIAGLIRERGPSQTFQAISQAAQCGALGMKTVFESSDLKERFQSQLSKIQTGEFAKHFQSSEWQSQAKDFTNSLDQWETRLKRKVDSNSKDL